MVTRAFCAAAIGAVVLLATTASASPAITRTTPPSVIGLIGDDGLNPLHAEFATRDGRDPRYPRGMPRAVRVELPREGDFATRLAELQAGPLGHPTPGTLYAVGGTRLLVYTVGGGSVLSDRAHGTGVAASAAGLRTGTASDALVVFVAGTTAAAYEWLAEQSWIDVASTSVYSIRTTEQCAGAAATRRMYRNGGLLFSSSGNTQDVLEPLSIPNGLPEVYQVGGVDASGRTWLPPHPEQSEPAFVVANVIRPYESGARFSFRAASGDSLNGSQPFGGTSGATPTVAGYASRLIAQARAVLHSAGGRIGQNLAVAGPGAHRRTRGPLADGRFTRDELVRILHNTARPAEPASAGRYAIEGYGATDNRSFTTALAVLEGTAPLPERAQEDAANATAENARQQASSRC